MKKILLVFAALLLVFLVYYFTKSETLEVQESTKVETESLLDNYVFPVKKEIFQAKNYMAVRFDALPMSEVTGELFGKTYGEIGKQIAKFGKGAPSALYYVWDDENSTVDLAIAIPLEEIPSKIPDGFSIISIPESESIYVDYYGSYANLDVGHNDLNNYILNQKMEGTFVAIEEYVTDPENEPDQNKWLTKISYVKLN